MSSISNYSVRKPITIVMAVLIVMILGFVSLTNLTTDLLPSINLPYAVIQTTYFGASPEVVEQMVTKPMENSMATVSNIKEITSVSQENMSLVILEFNEETNMDSALVEMREKIDMIMSFMPDEVNNPMIIKLNPDMMPIMNFSLSVGEKTVSESTMWIDNVIMPRLESIPGVATVTLTGTANNEIQVKLNEDKIKAVNEKLGSMNISKDMISGILAGQNFSMPAGYITEDNSDYLVRIGDKIEDLEAIKDLSIINTPFMQIKLKDVAEVEIVNISEKSYSKVNGTDAIMVTIQKQNNYVTTDVVESIQQELEKIQEEYKDVSIVTLMDQAEYINKSVSAVTNNLIYGAILAILILLLFLRDLRPTLIIALAIPISVITAFIMIYFAGITLNIISMGGLALGIGMLVDNSIVVIENIYRLKNEGHSAIEAAKEGAKQVAGAITASTLTTISVFAPIIFMKGLTAQIFKELALTISFSLLASLLIALSLVPMLASKIMVKHTDEKEHKIIDGIKKIYTNVLKFSLKHKVSVIVIVLLLFAGSIVGSFRIGTEFFPKSDQGQITVNLEIPVGATFDEGAELLDNVSEIISDIDGVETVGASFGGNDLFNMMTNGGSASINILLSDKRDKSTTEIIEEIRSVTIDEGYEVEISEQGMGMAGMGGNGISAVIKGHDLDKLETIANDLYDIIASVEGTTEIDNGIAKTSPELKITVDRDKSISKGLTTAQVFIAVKDSIKKEDKTSKLVLGGQEYHIKVLDKESNTKKIDIEAVKNLEISTPMGEKVKVSDIANVDIKSGFATINRENQSRTITVAAAVKEGFNIGKVGSAVKEKIKDYQLEDGYTVEMEGEQEEIASSFKSLSYALILAIILIYMVMASQFQSLLYPFIVMFSIPLAFTGGFLGLFVTATPISVVAFIGMIILAGIVVNNGIVLVDYINQLKENGKSTYEAVIEAGNTRLRPIIMTSLTTIIALSTMALGIGENAEMMQPMAITAIGGLMYATVLTLIVVPVIYAGLDKRFKKRA